MEGNCGGITPRTGEGPEGPFPRGVATRSTAACPCRVERRPNQVVGVRTRNGDLPGAISPCCPAHVLNQNVIVRRVAVARVRNARSARAIVHAVGDVRGLTAQAMAEESLDRSRYLRA